MKKKIVACMIVLVVAVAFMPTSAFAGSKAKMTTYSSLYKTKNTVYCAGSGGLYKVSLKKGKVKSTRVLYRTSPMFIACSYITGIKKKGKYVYFAVGGESHYWDLARIKTSGKGLQWLAFTNGCNYAIKGKKIYYGDKSDWDTSTAYYVMNLNGKSKHKTSKKAAMKSKKSNTSKYRIIMKEYKGYAYDYLKTPKGTFLLGKRLIEGSDYWGEDY